MFEGYFLVLKPRNDSNCGAIVKLEGIRAERINPNKLDIIGILLTSFDFYHFALRRTKTPNTTQFLI